MICALGLWATPAAAQGDDDDDEPAAQGDDDKPEPAAAAPDDDGPDQPAGGNKDGDPPAAAVPGARGDSAEDSDGDGTPDSVDADDDNDGKPDAIDQGEDDAVKAGADGDHDGTSDGADTDHDGTPDSADTDDDNDGTPDSADTDDDNDGTPDADEVAGGAAADGDGDGTPDSADTDDDNDGTPDADEAAAGAGADADGDGTPDSADTDDDNDGTPDSADTDDDNDGLSDDAEAAGAELDDDGEVYFDDDSDGDGVVSPEEVAEAKEFDAAFAETPNDVDDAALEARPEASELMPSIGIEDFRKLIRLAKRKVLDRMEVKITKAADAKMRKVSWGIFFFSLAGVLVLAMPLGLRKKYPGQTGNLFKYSALAAATFFVTVNLFGVILIGLRSTQSALSRQTNPQLKIAAGFFDSLDHNAEDYVVMGKELFAPTLKALTAKSDEQPAVLLIENGQKVVKSVSVFKTVADLFRKINFVFGVIPIVLLGVTLILFVLAIKPTLLEIIKLPATVAEGNARAGQDVVKRAMRRVGGEMVATVCTLGVLVVLSLLAGYVLGKVVEPALDSIISYFMVTVSYLQFVEGASVGQVYAALLSVIFFLGVNLAVLIASMSFFLGKSQKIFQQRFNDGVPMAEHRRWWKWGMISVLVAQLLPLIYLYPAALGVEAIENRIMDGVVDAEQVSWSQLMLAGPGFLILGFLVFLWAARGLRAVMFMAKYKVKPPSPR